MTCETKQKLVKGNFIISGLDLPKEVKGGNLFHIAARAVWEKYGVSMLLDHMKVLHRTGSGGIIFTLYGRMPGSLFESLMRVINSNPNRNIRVYLNIQLMEPFNFLYFMARRLKQYKLISYYRLDDNGYTWMSLSDQLNTFKFTSFNQLDLLGLVLPEALRKELNEYPKRKKAREKIRRRRETW